MKTKILFIFCLLTVSLACYTQPGTEIYLFDLVVKEGLFTLSNPINISSNPGYDNQPSFTNEGSLLYSSWRVQQVDLVKYSISDSKKTYLTNTQASEYSPTQMPGGNYLSTITLEPNGRQLLWKYPMNKPGKGDVLVPYLKIGYHTWLNDNILFAFVLGPHMTLQRIDQDAQTAEIVVDDIGRSIHVVPGTNDISFIKKQTDEWIINKYHVAQDSISAVTATLAGVEDMCWYDEGRLLMGKDHLLYQWSEKTDWVQCADLSQWNLTGISRVSISPDKQRLAIVVSE
ncbi:MAG: hypothetical protein RIC35_24835 [Marinoscillum sp.]